jgi:hypothetical protein
VNPRQRGAQQISENGPRLLGSSTVGLEKHLEEWIECDPSLVQGGLTIVPHPETAGTGAGITAIL